MPFCFISEPPSDAHVPAAFAQMHVTAFNNSMQDATVQAACTQDNPLHKHVFEDITLPHDDQVVYLIVYVMPHISGASKHKLDVAMLKPDGTSLDSDMRTGIVMDPPDDPDGGIHVNRYEFLLARKDFRFTGHDYLPKKLLASYMTPDGAYLKAKKGGLTTVSGEVKGGPKKLDLKLARREPHLEKDKPPAVHPLNTATGLVAGATWDTPVDTSTDRHGSVLTMEYKLDDKTYPVRFVLPVMDPAKKDTASKPKKGVTVFKIAK